MFGILTLLISGENEGEGRGRSVITTFILSVATTSLPQSQASSAKWATSKLKLSPAACHNSGSARFHTYGTPVTHRAAVCPPEEGRWHWCGIFMQRHQRFMHRSRLCLATIRSIRFRPANLVSEASPLLPNRHLDRVHATCEELGKCLYQPQRRDQAFPAQRLI